MTNTNYIINEIKKALGKNYEVKLSNVQKNNITRKGISIRKDNENVAANIYINENEDDDAIVLHTIDTYRNSLNTDRGDIDNFINNVKDWDYIKARVIPTLYNIGMNDMTAFVTKDLCGDIGIAFRIILGTDSEGSASVKVQRTMLDTWGVDIDTLFDAAKKNLNDKLMLTNMSSILFGLMTNTRSNKRLVTELTEPMGVIGTVDGMFGASAILLIPDLIKSGDLNKKDYTIIPSSVHECIVLDTDGLDNVMDINDMIKTVNATEVRAEDVLSNNGLKYNADTEAFEQIAA